MPYKSQEEVEKEVKYLPVLYKASKGDIEHFQSFVTKTRLSDLESIEAHIEGMKPILYHEDANRQLENAARYNTISEVLSYLNSLRG